jgi:hypothetical protein
MMFAFREAADTDGTYPANGRKCASQPLALVEMNGDKSDKRLYRYNYRIYPLFQVAFGSQVSCVDVA